MLDLKSAVERYAWDISTIKNNSHRSKNEAKNVRISRVYGTCAVDSPKFTTIYEQKSAN